MGDRLSKHCKTSDAGKGSSEPPVLEALLMIAMTSSMVSSLKWRNGVLLSATSSSGYTACFALNERRCH